MTQVDTEKEQVLPNDGPDKNVSCVGENDQQTFGLALFTKSAVIRPSSVPFWPYAVIVVTRCLLVNKGG